MFATILNVYAHSGNIYLCLICAIADVNKRLSSIFYKYVNQWFQNCSIPRSITSKKVKSSLFPSHKMIQCMLDRVLNLLWII